MTKIIIERYNTEKGNWVQDFNLLIKNETILELLNKIKWNFDSSLSYRSSCTNGICGECSVKVNDKVVLACETLVKDCLVNDSVRISPISNFKVIKDLIVDLDNYFKDLRLGKNKENFDYGVNKCNSCAICDSNNNFPITKEIKKFQMGSNSSLYRDPYLANCPRNVEINKILEKQKTKNNSSFLIKIKNFFKLI